MKAGEVLCYLILYGYVIIGFGYIIKKGLSVSKFESSPEFNIPIIGIYDRTYINMDNMFEEQGIPQIEL